MLDICLNLIAIMGKFTPVHFKTIQRAQKTVSQMLKVVIINKSLN